MRDFKVTKNILFGILIIFTSHSYSNNQNIEEIVVGMTLKSVCKINSDNFRKRDDPCHGYFQYYEEKRVIMLWDINRSIFLVFNNVPSEAINRRDRLNIKKTDLNSKLLLLTSSGDEAIYFIENILN
tara:strand:- start:148 stop:528 length:381 start_codon:yes stop_codon:yes gene_type:complete